MSSVIGYLARKNIGCQPKWLATNVAYETIMGSEAYGVASGSSDTDVYGFAIPPKWLAFPHTTGHVYGFGPKPQGFDQYQEHHLDAPERRKQYDVTIFSIIKYFDLVAQNNPNALDSLFTPDRCILHISPVGLMVRDNRKMFLHKGAWHKFRGYAKSQLHKIEIKKPKQNTARAEDIEKYGVDTKYLYHTVRLLLECEQILEFGDIDIQRDKDTLKAIRKGEWTYPDIMVWQEQKMLHLDRLYETTKLPASPDYDALRKLLIDCLEQHYGSIEDAVRSDVEVADLMNDMQNVIDSYKRKLSNK